MSANEVDPSVRPAPVRRVRGALARFPDRWAFRRKLNILVGVPLVVVAGMLAYGVDGQVDQARAAAGAAQQVRDSVRIADLVDRVATEHQQAVLLSVRFEAMRHGDSKPSLTAFRAAQSDVDSHVAAIRQDLGARLPEKELQALKEISGLGSLRGTIEQSYLPSDNIDPAYSAAAEDLIDGLGLDQNSDLASTFTGNLLDSLLRADAAHSAFETSVFSARTGDTNALIQFVNAVGNQQQYTYQAARFARFATEKQATVLAGVQHNVHENAIEVQYAGLQIDPSALAAETPAQVRAAFTKALAAYPDYRQEAQTRLRITESLIGQIADRADASASDAWWRVGWLLGGALLAFVLWLAFSVAIRRSVARPVLALTGAAKQVADVAGRELARVADDDAADDSPPRLREVPITVRDEIGELAEAFNRVQVTAGALLERQVLSRRNVAEMFGNVGRRVSNLTTRQLALIDAIERGETDPALLDQLYRIDHIAVRLQRNADSLMLLAGIRETGLETSPTALTNVVRAALGQIEGYQRVSLLAETEVTVAPDIIGDLTLMLAELLENAVSFSPVRSPVEVTVRTGADGALIEISDHGLGMSAERIEEENARLVRRERLDLVPTKVLGLFVVGSLARRWGVGVTLARTPGGGVTSQVSIPSTLLLMMSPMTPSRPATAQRHERAVPAAGPTPALPAAEPAPAAASVPLPAAVPAAVPAAAVTEAPNAAPPAAEPPRAPQRADVLPPREGALPRRVPRHQAGPAGEALTTTADTATADITTADTTTADTATAGTTTLPPATSPGSSPAATGPHEDREDAQGRPLRRRVRGATLRTTVSAAAQQAAARAPRLADADEVRSELDEFDAAVERAHRDSALLVAESRTTTDEPGLPEGAEQ